MSNYFLIGGISVTIFRDPYPCADGTTGCVERNKLAIPIEATLEFSDSSKVWLEGVQDLDSYDPRNWIASGSYSPSSEDDMPGTGVFNPSCYGDIVGADPNKDFSNILDGTVTIGQLARRNTCGYTPIGVPQSNGINLPGAFATISSTRMPSIFQTSVDIVYTSDKSKWRSEERRVGKECR